MLLEQNELLDDSQFPVLAFSIMSTF